MIIGDKNHILKNDKRMSIAVPAVKTDGKKCTILSDLG